jgi:hypothetical protein
VTFVRREAEKIAPEFLTRSVHCRNDPIYTRYIYVNVYFQYVEKNTTTESSTSSPETPSHSAWSESGGCRPSAAGCARRRPRKATRRRGPTPREATEGPSLLRDTVCLGHGYSEVTEFLKFEENLGGNPRTPMTCDMSRGEVNYCVYLLH